MNKKHFPLYRINKTGAAVENDKNYIQRLFMEFMYNQSTPVSIWKTPDGLKVNLPIKKQIDMLYHSICLDANKAALNYFRCKTRDEMVGNKYISLAKDRSFDTIFNDFIKNYYLLQDYQIRDILKNGDEYYGLENWYGIIKNDQLNYICVMSRNLTEYKKTEKTLFTQLDENDQMLNTMLNGFILADGKGQVIRVNPAYCAMVGYSEEELLNMNIRDLEIKNNKKNECPAKNMVSKGSARFESKHKHKNGHLVDIDASIVVLQSKNTPLIAAFLRDITEYKMAEKALQREKNKAQEYLHIAGAIIIAIDLKGNVTLINQKGSEVLGYDQKNVVGKNWFNNFIHPSMEKEVKNIFAKLIRNEIGPTSYYENPILTKNGEKRIIAWNNILLKDDEDNIIGTLSSGEDITERKRYEKELKIYQNHLEKLVHERTEELEKTNQELLQRSEELEAFNKVMVDREIRIIEMKKEVNALCKELGLDVRYPPVWEK